MLVSLRSRTAMIHSARWQSPSPTAADSLENLFRSYSHSSRRTLPTRANAPSARRQSRARSFGAAAASTRSQAAAKLELTYYTRAADARVVVTTSGSALAALAANSWKAA